MSTKGAKRNVSVQADRSNRQLNNSLGINVRQMFEFVTEYDEVTRTKLVVLNQKLNDLERQMEILEAHVTTVINSPDQF